MVRISSIREGQYGRVNGSLKLWLGLGLAILLSVVRKVDHLCSVVSKVRLMLWLGSVLGEILLSASVYLFLFMLFDRLS